MKKPIYLFTISMLLITFVSFTCNNTLTEQTSILPSDLQGSWRLIDASHIKSSGNKQIKHFTNTHFAWQWSDSLGIVTATAGGTYSIKNDSIYETIKLGSPGMRAFIGTTAKIKFEIKNDTLVCAGLMPNNFKFVERWVREK